MTEDMKQRLRAVCETGCDPDLPFEAADRIEQLEKERDGLLAALYSVLSMDVKGHQFQDRMQFSSAGRAILDQCNSAIYAIKPKP